MQEISKQSQSLFPIGELSSKTGINSVTLRAWERRYGLLKPQRTSKGHRLYSAQDTGRVRQILLLIERGVPLRKIKPLLEGKEPLMLVQHDGEGQEWQQQIRGVLEAFNQQALAQRIQQLFKQYPASWCGAHVIAPLFSGLADHPLQAALEALLQAELLRYVARCQPAEKTRKPGALMTLGGALTAAWRPALLALQLAEQQACLWMPGVFSLTALQQLLILQPGREVLYCLDGVLNAADNAQLRQLLDEHPQLSLQGTAAKLAFAGHKQLKEVL